MPDIYSIRYFKNRRQKNKTYIVCIALGLLMFLYPEYPKRLFYPFLFGQKTNEKLEISQDACYEDLNTAPITFARNNIKYILYPQTKYSVSAKIGYVDSYDTILNKIYRGHSQSDYINLAPIDLFMIYGDMAKPEIYKLFEFDHEERTGYIKCKGVKYKESFFSFYLSDSEREKSEKNLAVCNPHINENQFNNYHPIPANENVNKGLHTLLAGDIIYIEGYLVNVKAPSFTLATGTRTNQHHPFVMNGENPGMCFIIYTTKIIVNGYVYQ